MRLLSAFLVGALLVKTADCQSKHGTPKKPTAKADAGPPLRILWAEGSLVLSDATVEAIREALPLVDQIGTGALTGRGKPVIGLQVKIDAAVRRAEEGGAGDQVVAGMLLNYRSAKLHNADLEEKVSDLGLTATALRRMDGGTLYEREQAYLNADPLKLAVNDREEACRKAIDEMLDAGQAKARVVECETASVDPKAPFYPLQSLDGALRKAKQQDSGIGGLCEATLRNALDSVDDILDSSAGVFGVQYAGERLNMADAFCESPGERLGIRGARGFYRLKLTELRSGLDVLEAYMASQKGRARTMGDFMAAVEQSWKEVDFDPKAKIARSKSLDCVYAVDAAMEAGKLDHILTECEPEASGGAASQK